MRPHVESTDEALAEAASSTAWCGERSPRAAAELEAEIVAAVRRIGDQPSRRARHLHATRRVRLRRFQFAVVHRERPDGTGS